MRTCLELGTGAFVHLPLTIEHNLYGKHAVQRLPQHLCAKPSGERSISAHTFGTALVHMHALSVSQQLADLNGGIGMVDESCASARNEDAPPQYSISTPPAHAHMFMTPVHSAHPTATYRFSADTRLADS